MKNINEDCAEIVKCEWVVLVLLFIALPIGLAGIAIVAIGYIIFITKSNVMRMLLITIVAMAISG